MLYHEVVGILDVFVVLVQVQHGLAGNVAPRASHLVQRKEKKGGDRDIVMRCNAGKLYSVCMHCIITVQLEEVRSMSHIVHGGDDRGQHGVEDLQCLGSNTRGILLGGWGDARTGGVRYIWKPSQPSKDHLRLL